MIVEMGFKKSTSIKFFYSYVKITAVYSEDFHFKSNALWPPSFDDVGRCEEKY